MCDTLCCCVDDAKKEPRISPDPMKSDSDVSVEKKKYNAKISLNLRFICKDLNQII